MSIEAITAEVLDNLPQADSGNESSVRQALTRIAKHFDENGKDGKPFGLLKRQHEAVLRTLLIGAFDDDERVRRERFFTLYDEIRKQEKNLPKNPLGLLLVIRSELARHNPRTLQEYKKARLLRTELHDSVFSWDSLDSPVKQGLVILSVVLDSLCLKKTKAVLKAMSTRENVDFRRSGVNIFVSKPLEHRPAWTIRFAPVTAMILFRLDQEGLWIPGDERTRKKVLRLAIESILPEQRKLGKALETIRRYALAYSFFTLPPAVSDLLSGRVDSLPHGRRALVDPDPRVVETVPVTSEWHTALREILNSSNPRQTLRQEGYEDIARSRVVQIVLQWLEERLNPRKYKPTHPRYRRSALLLAETLHDCEEALSRDEEIDSEVILGNLSLSMGMLQRVTYRRDFAADAKHFFGGIAKRVPQFQDINPGELPEFERMPDGTRTNPFYPKDWEHVLETSRKASRNDRLCTLLSLLGLRSLDIHNLRYRDLVVFDDEVTICIPNSKTKAGQRAVPAHFFLDKEDIDFLRAIRNEEALEGRRWDRFLMGGETQRKSDYVSARTKKVIGRCAFQEKITPHILRHGFASFLVLGHALNRKCHFQIHHHFPEYAESLERFRAGAKHLEAALGKSADRAYLWGLAAIIGHQSPGMTLQAYVHTAHVMNYAFLLDIQPALPRSVVAEFCRVNESTVNEKKKATLVNERFDLVSSHAQALVLSTGIRKAELRAKGKDSQVG